VRHDRIAPESLRSRSFPAAASLAVAKRPQSPTQFAIYVLYAYNYPVPVSFDPKKDAVNLKKHGVSLAEGDGVLGDPLAVTIEDQLAEGESRFVTLGDNVFGFRRVVVWTQRKDDVRIISVRKPTRKERKTYEEEL
jgi:uncharacterized protein